MPRRAGRGVPLAELKKRVDSCAACQASLGTDEPLAWTWSRQRIHEACMPVWTLANRGRRALGEWIAEPVRLLLDRHDGRLCAACLALALFLSLEEARQIVDITGSVPGFRVLPVTCQVCGRFTAALCTVPLERKCTLCSRPLDGGPTVTVDGAHFHRACSDVISAQGRIRASRVTSRAARAQLERARATLDRARPPA